MAAVLEEKNEVMYEYEDHGWHSNPQEQIDKDDAKDLEKLLTAVIKGRTSVPGKCITLHKQTVISNAERLEFARVKLQESKEKENFKRTVQEIKRLKNPMFSIRDLLDGQDKYDKCFSKTKKINDYLKRQR